MSCHRDPIKAAARTTPAQVATARVKGEARQRNSASVRRISITCGPRNRQPSQQFLDDICTVHAAHPHLGLQADPVRHGRNGKRLHVFGYHVVAAEQKRARTGMLDEVEFGSRAGADRNLRVLPGGVGQRHDVVQHVFVHRHLLHRLPHRDQIMGIHNLIHRRLGRTALEAAAQHRTPPPVRTGSGVRAGSRSGPAAPRVADRCPRTRSGCRWPAR